MKRIQTIDGRQKAWREAEIRVGRLAGILLLGAAELAAQTRPPSPARVKEHRVATERKIVVSIPDRKLALIENGIVVKVYRVAVGRRATPSPTGMFFIADRVKNPTYYRPGVVIPPGKWNPVGTRWMGLSIAGYGIHGTDEPRSIGHRASHGCIRMLDRDAQDLYARVRVGDEVLLHAHADAVTRALFHPAATSARVLSARAYVGAGNR